MRESRVLGALLISVSSGFAYQVQVNFDPAIHFSSYKTYRLVQSTAAQSLRALSPNRLMEERIAGFIEERLATAGLKLRKTLVLPKNSSVRQGHGTAG
jgi:hypothetical protein